MIVLSKLWFLIYLGKIPIRKIVLKGLDMRWKYDLKLFAAKKLASDCQSETSFLAGNTLMSCFHLKSKPTMPLIYEEYTTLVEDTKH